MQNLIDGYQSLENSLSQIADSITEPHLKGMLMQAIGNIQKAKASQEAIRDAINDALLVLLPQLQMQPN